MNFILGLQVGLKEILSHKFRSFLTMLGVILGVASLMAMFALTEGMARGMREVLESRGGIERVEIDTKDVSHHLKDFAFLSRGRSLEDATAILKGAPLVDLVSPESRLGNASLQVGDTIIRQTVIGSLPGYDDMIKLKIKHGRSIADLDLNRAHRVAVLGSTTAESLWPENPDSNPVGRTILINDSPFRVIGVWKMVETEQQRRERELGKTSERRERLQKRGKEPGRRWDPFHWQNNNVLIPITTMFNEFKSVQFTGGVDQGPDRSLNSLSFRISNIRFFEEAIAQVQNVLNRTHRGIDDFAFDTREDWFDSIETSVRSTRMSGGLIAGISLIVGGIGITNIMLASITERIREIGVRRAVGATGRDIFSQIVVESAVIGLIGGVIGLLVSGLLMKLLVVMSPETNAPVVTVSAVVVSFSFALLIGIVAGLYPAWKAARLDPIEALRYG